MVIHGVTQPIFVPTLIAYAVLISLSSLSCYGSLLSDLSPHLIYPESQNPGCYKAPQQLTPQVGVIEHTLLGSAVDNWIFKFLVEEQLGIGVRMVS